jgi:tripartite-type tricarboxylate transporter receptor subunit TctC
VQITRALPLFAVSLLLPVFAPAAQDQTFPTRPVRLIVPFPPGGGNDILARTVGQRLTEVVGQSIVVDNRAGAGGVIGAAAAATSRRTPR